MYNIYRRDLPPPIPFDMITREQKPILTSGNILQITGQEKTCKTTFLREISKSLVDGKDRLGFSFSACPENRQVLYINTELSAYDFWEFCRSIEDSVPDSLRNRFVGLNGQSFTPSAMLESFDRMMLEYSPHVVIIDGIVDYVQDFNNPVESKKVVDYLAAKCAQRQCAAIVTLHQNPGTYSGKSRGHLGTYLGQRAVGTLSTYRHKDHFSLKGTRLRYSSGFTHLFTWAVDSLPEYKGNKNGDKSSIGDLISMITPGILKSELAKKYMSGKGKDRKYTYAVIKEALGAGLIKEEVISPRKSIIHLPKS